MKITPIPGVISPQKGCRLTRENYRELRLKSFACLRLGTEQGLAFPFHEVAGCMGNSEADAAKPSPEITDLHRALE